MECLFCRIVSGDEPAEIVPRTDTAVGFLDTRPVFKGHVLLVPRDHIFTLSELPDDQVEPLFVTARTLAGVMRTDLGAQGSFVAMNNVVSQSVPHLHVHVVPRTKGDGLRGFFWPRTKYDEGEAEAYGRRLREALGTGAA